MAAIRIQLAGRNEASVIALEGERITIGRFSTNLLQILHPALSCNHAELIYEEDHYHLHDVGSTNGVFVNGQRVTDYHLRETCKLAFGTLECEFLAEVPSDLNVPVEPLPSRLTVSTAQSEDADLKALLTRLQVEIESLQDTAASQAEARAVAVARDQQEKVLGECESLKTALTQAQADMAALCLARDDLQRAYDQQKAELDARPTQSQLDSSLAENSQLKTRLEALAQDSEELTTLRGEHSALKDALGLFETEMLQVKAERNSSRRENSKLQATMEVQARELVSLQESHASLSREMATRVPAEEHRNLAVEHASAKQAQARLQEEITQLRKEHEVDITALCSARDDLQRAYDQQKAELDARPTQSQLDSSLAENSQLKTRLEALAKDSEELTTLRGEHSALKDALGLFETEMLQVKAERNSSRRENSKLQATMEVQARELASLQESHASLSREMATRIPAEEHQKVVAECSSAKQVQARLQEEFTRLEQNLEGLAADREALQNTVAAQRAELETLPKPAELDALRVANAALEERARELTKLAADQGTSAKEAQERLQEEITQLRKEHEVDISALYSARDDLQRACEQQKAELDARPTQSQLDSSLAENSQLKTRLEVLAKDSEELTTLRGEHSALKDALGLFETEMLQVKAERNSSRRENSKLQATMEVQARELVSLQESHASLSREMATRIPAEEHQKVVAECSSAKQAQARLQEEFTRLEQNLEGLAADREALQNTVAAQRAELETLPKPAELDALRVANAALEDRARELTKLAADQGTSAKEAQEHLHEEITQLRQNLADLAADREALRNTVDAQRAELETLPKPAELDSLRVANAALEERTKELMALAADRDAAAREAQERFQEEITHLKQNLADLAADRESLQKTINAQRAELERMPSPAELDSLRIANAELEERAKSLEKTASGQASPKESRERHREEITQLKKSLADLTADREALRKMADAQRVELDTMPKPEELDSLRATNTKLEERVKDLTTEIAALSKTLSAFYVLRGEHEKLVADHSAMKEAQHRREAELQQVNHRLAESLTQHANFARTLKAREDELEALRNRSDTSGPIPHITSNFNEARTTAGYDRQSLSKISTPRDMGLEEAFEELGFVIRPVRHEIAPAAEMKDSSAHSDAQQSER